MKLCLYKSGVHKILGLPRRWVLPKPSISLPAFKKALELRDKALAATTAAAAVASSAHEECSDESSRKRKRVDATDEEEAPAKQICVADDKEAFGEQDSSDLDPQQQAPPEVQPKEDTSHNVENGSTYAADPVLQERAKRKEELEEKLKTLTSEKHRLVQLLKQILTNEEEMKRRAQTTSSRPCDAPLLSQTPAARPMDLEEGELEYARSPSPRLART
ncbi:uncharacterized protein LOC9661761 [Selaginella moellendorffii]|uniref:uncharacterized protein LOC9661761 n=1 Tax=Selaginella moellendorffii TaxID=88036 RepID=UPI000D1C96C0|nr:uncharacterized protein LOC9661761 [Selaginella moellendorffii]|eukprot:XP_024515837.1 uncharacterized protein LOC9661761 [Selaginella moellendorffii]